ncbi:hypothetical protein SCMC78_40010 [Streptomyces sp. CMC78]|uniref:Integral membrane protein n=1 Tax=Streptomyces sp. CMC78 TaxID=3231512 RepID=A0AB33KK79_9ACTN
MAVTDTSLRGIWAAIIITCALTIAVTTSGIFWSTGMPASGALGAGGVAFMGATTLGITLRRFVSG